MLLSNMKKILFVVNDLARSGGVHVILRHASYLAEQGHQVTLGLTTPMRDSWEVESELLSVTSIETCLEEQWELCIFTFWKTTLWAPQVKANRFMWFMQSFEERFYPSADSAQSLARALRRIPFDTVVVAEWMKTRLLEDDPTRRVALVRNGLDHGDFTSYSRLSLSKVRDPAPTLMVEGDLGTLTKNTEWALDVLLNSNLPINILHLSRSPLRTKDSRYRFVQAPVPFKEVADLYSEAVIMLKVSLVEGMFGPPLEAMACGCVPVVSPVTGSEEYIKDGVNSRVVSWDDRRGLENTLLELISNPSMLDRLREGGIETAKNWPDWDTASGEFAKAILGDSPDFASLETSWLSQTVTVISELVAVSISAKSNYATMISAREALRVLQSKLPKPLSFLVLVLARLYEARPRRSK